MNYLILGVIVFFGWLVHVGLGSLYGRFFDNYSGMAFRLVHMIEIATVMGLIAIAYKTYISQPLSLVPALLTTLATLAVIDLVAFGLIPALRDRFDIGHFIGAYIVVGLVFWTVYFASK